jgi:hypothetical protein
MVRETRTMATTSGRGSCLTNHTIPKHEAWRQELNFPAVRSLIIYRSERVTGFAQQTDHSFFSR